VEYVRSYNPRYVADVSSVEPMLISGAGLVFICTLFLSIADQLLTGSAEGPFTCSNVTIQNNDIGPCGSEVFQEVPSLYLYVPYKLTGSGQMESVYPANRAWSRTMLLPMRLMVESSFSVLLLVLSEIIPSASRHVLHSVVSIVCLL
jgi:hypothetical protein